MLPRHHPDRIRIAFDDHRLVANAGLILPATLARRLGLPKLVHNHLDLGRALGRANTGDKMMTLVASALAGGDCIDDADVLRTGGTARALGLGLAACQNGMSVGFTTAAGLVHELMEARDERRLLNLQRQLSRLNLLIIDELGFVPLSPTGAELLFEVFSQRYERGSTLVTTNLPFDEWNEVFGSERLTGALLDRLTHHVHILGMNGESYRLKRSRESAVSQPSDEPHEE